MTEIERERALLDLLIERSQRDLDPEAIERFYRSGFDQAQEDSVREFCDAVARGFDRMIGAYRDALPQVQRFFDLLVVEPRRRRTRSVVQAQRRRRGR